MKVSDDIIDGLDEGLARKAITPEFTGEPLTGDEILAWLEALPPGARAKPMLVALDGRPGHILAMVGHVLLAEETPF